MLTGRDADNDLPLKFEIRGIVGNNLLYIRELPCSNNTAYPSCNAYVYLKQALEPGRVYEFQFAVSDTKGDITDVPCRIKVARETTCSKEVFVDNSPTVFVPEDQQPKTSIYTFVVNRKTSSSIVPSFVVQTENRKNLFYVRVNKLLSNSRIEADLMLAAPLDYEDVNLYTVLLCAINAYTDETVDTRNIACVKLFVKVDDRQDMPPWFVNPPAMKYVPSDAQPGDVIAVINAVDPDTEDKRSVRYTVQFSVSIFIDFFEIDSVSGEITLTAPLSTLYERMSNTNPVIVTITAEEVLTSINKYPALSSTIDIALVILNPVLLLPKFVYATYQVSIEENSPPDTKLQIEKILDKNIKGVFEMAIENCKGAFSVSPAIVRDGADPEIRVKNSELLDYEREKQLNCVIVVKQISGERRTATASLIVKILDMNDNDPEFSQAMYITNVVENTSFGPLLKVTATDKDSSKFNTIVYTGLYGPLSSVLSLDPNSGIISIGKDGIRGLDREVMAVNDFTVEARDNDGLGRKATAKVRINVDDTNDNPPKFQKSHYETVLIPPLYNTFKTPTILTATDDDAEAPNNQVEYSIVSTQYRQYFNINPKTGELSVNSGVGSNQILQFAGIQQESKTEVLSREERSLQGDGVIILNVRATDLGSPALDDTVPVYVYTREYAERYVNVIYPTSAQEVRYKTAEIERKLSILTGGVAEIKGTKPYTRKFSLDYPVEDEGERTMVTALVRFDTNTVVDVDQVSRELNDTLTFRPMVQKIDTQRKELLNQSNQITTLQKSSSSYYSTMVVMTILFVTLLIVAFLLCCCYCPCCPYYSNAKRKTMVGDEQSGRISYIDGQGYKNGGGSYYDERGYWDYLPGFCTDILVSCGATRPERTNSRLAWSGDERQRYWRFEQGQDNRGVVNERNLSRSYGGGGYVGGGGMGQVGSLVAGGGLPGGIGGQRDSLMLEDLDSSRLARQSQVMRVDSRSSQAGQEPRRVFVLRDPKGVPRSDSQLREGETYLIEDVDDVPRNGRPSEDNRQVQVMNVDDDATFTRQGNAEVLRLHASPRDGAMPIESIRRYRQAGVEPGGMMMIHDDAGDGYRIIEGHSMTPRSDQEYDDMRGYGTNNYNNFNQDDSYIDGEDGYHGRGQEPIVPPLRIGSPILEETASLLEADGIASNRDKNRNRPRPDVHRSKADIERDDRAKIDRIRKERAEKDKQQMENADKMRDNRARAEEKRAEKERNERMKKIESKKESKKEIKRDNSQKSKQGKKSLDPSTHVYRNTKSTVLRQDYLRKSRENLQEDSISQLDAPTNISRSNSQISLNAKNSISNLETNLEKEAAKRIGRGVPRDESIERLDPNGDSKDIMPPVEVRGPGEGQADSNREGRSLILNSDTNFDGADNTDVQIAEHEYQSQELHKPRKISNMLEKKSIFTIAYDDMHTQQLRPESAPSDP